MKKQASTLLPALLDLLRQYLALDMAVYAGHATLLLLTASLPLLMWVLALIPAGGGGAALPIAAVICVTGGLVGGLIGVNLSYR